MKFHQLSIGQRFEFEGEVYVRTRPMIAVREANGSSRMIRRSATVRVLAQETAASTPTHENEGLEREAVLQAFDVFYAHCLRELGDIESAADSEQMKQVRGSLKEARGRFLESLSLKIQEAVISPAAGRE